MVSAGLAIFGVSVVAQGVQWTANARQTQDWIALAAASPGALIVGAGVGSSHRVAPSVATAPARPRTR